MTSATPVSLRQPCASASDGGRRCCSGWAPAPLGVQERAFEVDAERTGTWLGGRPASKRGDRVVPCRDGRRDHGRHERRDAALDEEGCDLADAFGLRRQIDTDRAVDLQVDEAGQHRAPGRVDDMIDACCSVWRIRRPMICEPSTATSTDPPRITSDVMARAQAAPRARRAPRRSARAGPTDRSPACARRDRGSRGTRTVLSIARQPLGDRIAQDIAEGGDTAAEHDDLGIPRQREQQARRG